MSAHLYGCARGAWLGRQSLADALAAALLRMGPRCTCGAGERLREAGVA